MEVGHVDFCKAHQPPIQVIFTTFFFKHQAACKIWSIKLILLMTMGENCRKSHFFTTIDARHHQKIYILYIMQGSSKLLMQKRSSDQISAKNRIRLFWILDEKSMNRVQHVHGHIVDSTISSERKCEKWFFDHQHGKKKWGIPCNYITIKVEAA